MTSMDLSRKITLNTAVQVIGRGGVILFSLFTTAILTRNLGQAGYGVFGVINTAVIMFFSFADWGTNMIAVREAAKSPRKEGRILGNCLYFRTLMALVATLVFGLFVILNPAMSQFKTEALIATAIIVLLSFKTSAQIVFHSQLRLHLAALVELVAAGLFLVFLLFARNLSLTSVVIFLGLSALLAALFAFYLAAKRVKIDFRFDRKLIRHLISESLPMGAILAVYSVYNRIDTFMLQSIKGEAATGLYVLAYKVHDNLILGAAYLMNAFFPVIANYFQKDNQADKLKTILQKAFDLLLAMAIPVIVIFFGFAPLIIGLLGGQEFLISANILRILIIATAVGYLNHLTGYSLAALGYQRVHLKFGLLALVVNVILNLAFIPKYSYYGAALVTVITETLVFVLTFSYLKKALKMDFSFRSFPQTAWELIRNRGKVF